MKLDEKRYCLNKLNTGVCFSTGNSHQRNTHLYLSLAAALQQQLYRFFRGLAIFCLSAGPTFADFPETVLPETLVKSKNTAGLVHLTCYSAFKQPLLLARLSSEQKHLKNSNRSYDSYLQVSRL